MHAENLATSFSNFQLTIFYSQRELVHYDIDQIYLKLPHDSNKQHQKRTGKFDFIFQMWCTWLKARISKKLLWIWQIPCQLFKRYMFNKAIPIGYNIRIFIFLKRPALRFLPLWNVMWIYRYVENVYFLCKCSYRLNNKANCLGVKC